MMYPSTEDVRKTQMIRAEEQLDVISQRLDDLKSRIQRVQQQQQHDKQQQVAGKCFSLSFFLIFFFNYFSLLFLMFD